MLVLGIETSCDETAASVVRDGKTILSNVVSSSLFLHNRYGGIVPEIASRAQIESIDFVVERALKESKSGLSDIGLLSVAYTPGLAGALLVGVSYAKAICFARDLPLVGVNHILAHIYGAYMYYHNKIKFPFMGFVVSGGHTSLIYFKDVNRQQLLGKTRDDAAGEAFDKVAKLLGLGYPGGPVIERFAQKGDPESIGFPRAFLNGSLDFSFSGIKTAVMHYVRRQKTEDRRQKNKNLSSVLCRLSSEKIHDICASFQEAVVDVLVYKAILACKQKRAKQLFIGGGVACNLRFRERLICDAAKNDIDVFFPPKELCLDNAAMVAGMGYELFKNGARAGYELTAVST